MLSEGYRLHGVRKQQCKFVEELRAVKFKWPASRKSLNHNLLEDGRVFFRNITESLSYSSVLTWASRMVFVRDRIMG